MVQVLSPSLETKKKAVHALAQEMKKAHTILIASTKNLPSAKFHMIKKNMRGKADIRVAKKSLILRAITQTEKGSLQNLKPFITADVALFLSQEDAFKLSALLADNQTPSKAKAGEIAPEDIVVEPGPTELIPGPAISELSGVGLKVAVEGGKLAIKQGATVVKKGETVTGKVASVLGKLNINPMHVGFIPIAAYDSTADKVYENIVIDKKSAYENLKSAIAKALNFAINIGDVNEKTVGYFIAKAGMEEKVIDNLINKKSDKALEGESKNE